MVCGSDAGLCGERWPGVGAQPANPESELSSGINALGPSVLVMRVQQQGHSRRVSFPATIHGYIETPIYAKTPGYLKAIYVDKGDRVHKGEVLAILDSPELDKQVADAKANYWLRKLPTDAMRNWSPSK